VTCAFTCSSRTSRCFGVRRHPPRPTPPTTRSTARRGGRVPSRGGRRARARGACATGPPESGSAPGTASARRAPARGSWSPSGMSSQSGDLDATETAGPMTSRSAVAHDPAVLKSSGCKSNTLGLCLGAPESAGAVGVMDQARAPRGIERADRLRCERHWKKSWPGCRIDASVFVEKVSGSRPGCP
jgi:hypothetical protein